jgi:hypothetical protein
VQHQLSIPADFRDFQQTIPEDLIEVMLANGHTQEVKAWTTAGIVRPITGAHALASVGLIDEAVDMLRNNADAGGIAAARELVEILLNHGRLDELHAEVMAGTDFAAEAWLKLNHAPPD